MIKFQPAVKWSGSKRNQSGSIVREMPKEIGTYYEPFLGGGSVMYQLLHSDIKVDKYICSDFNKELITIWNKIKNQPNIILDNYEQQWEEINSLHHADDKRDKYNNIRRRYNETKSANDFFFLTRACANGLIRYNSKGEFNSPYHSGRKGINPKRLESIILQWSEKINEKNVYFKHMDYQNIKTSKGDLLYLDPPYANLGGLYYGHLDYTLFWKWLEDQKGSYLLSFDGKLGSKDNTYSVPENLYKKHMYLDNGISGFKKIHQQEEYGKESLYINLK